MKNVRNTQKTRLLHRQICYPYRGRLCRSRIYAGQARGGEAEDGGREESEREVSISYPIIIASGFPNFVRFFSNFLLPFDFFFLCLIPNTDILLQSLRTRFLQSQEDVAYTILALLPTLSSQVLKEMDIDVLTRELQVRSRARSARAHLSAVTSRPPSSLASSVDVVSHPTPNRPTAASLPIPAPAIHHDDADTRSDGDSVANSSEAESRISEAEEIYAPSVSAVSTSKSAYHTAISGSFTSDTNSVTQSWVVESTTSGPGDAEIERSRSPAASAASSGKGHNSETASAAGDGEGERLMVHIRAAPISIN